MVILVITIRTQQLLMGAALIGLSFVLPGAGGLAASGFLSTISLQGIAMKMGISMVLSGVMGMIMKTPKPSVIGGQTTDSEARIENKIFHVKQTMNFLTLFTTDQMA